MNSLGFNDFVESSDLTKSFFGFRISASPHFFGGSLLGGKLGMSFKLLKLRGNC